MKKKVRKNKKKSFVRFTVVYFLPLVFWMGLIFYLSSVPSLAAYPLFNWKAFLMRKSAHISEYFILNILFLRFFLNFKRSLKKNDFFKFLLISAVSSYVYAASDEIHQLFVYGREGSIRDLMFDLLGILISTIFVSYFYLRLKRKKIKK